MVPTILRDQVALAHHFARNTRVKKLDRDGIRLGLLTAPRRRTPLCCRLQPRAYAKGLWQGGLSEVDKMLERASLPGDCGGNGSRTPEECCCGSSKRCSAAAGAQSVPSEPLASWVVTRALHFKYVTGWRLTKVQVHIQRIVRLGGKWSPPRTDPMIMKRRATNRMRKLLIRIVALYP